MLQPFEDQNVRKANLFCDDVIYFTMEGSNAIQSGTIIRVNPGMVKVVLKSDDDGGDVIMEELDLNKITLYGKPERASYTFQEHSQREPQKWIHILYSSGEVEPPVSLSATADPWEHCKSLAVDEAAVAQETHSGEIGLLFDKEQGRIRLHYPGDDTYCFYQISERKMQFQFYDGQDAVFLPGKIHGAEHQVYILYFNAEANLAKGAWEIEILDADRILSIYEETSGNAELFFNLLPERFQNEWYSCNSNTLEFWDYASAYVNADFILNEDGDMEQELDFLVNWAKQTKCSK